MRHTTTVCVLMAGFALAVLSFVFATPVWAESKPLKKFKWDQAQMEIVKKEPGILFTINSQGERLVAETDRIDGSIFVRVYGVTQPRGFRKKQGLEGNPPRRFLQIDIEDGKVVSVDDIINKQFWTAFKGWPNEEKNNLIDALKGKLNYVFIADFGEKRFEIFANVIASELPGDEKK